MARRHGKPKLNDIVAGSLPNDAINRTLGIDAEPGVVLLSRAAQRHIHSGHPGELEQILPRLSQIVEQPLYMGDDHRNPGKIELVGRIPNHAGAALVAVKIERNEGEDHYHICSAYLLTQREVDRKREKRILKNVR